MWSGKTIAGLWRILGRCGNGGFSIIIIVGHHDNHYHCLVCGATARGLEQAEAAGDGGYHGDAQTAGGARGAEGGCNGGDCRRRTAEETFRGNIVFFVQCQ